MALNEVDEKSLEIWHRRLGHYYLENINKYLSLHQIKTPKCIECKVAKMSRKSHGRKNTKSYENIRNNTFRHFRSIQFIY